MEKTEQTYRGKISFVNFEKHFATIDYLQGTKPKSVNFKTSAEGNDKKPQHYRVNDVVSFQLRLSDRGDKMTAYNVKFLHNEAIDRLIQKAAFENRFSGYLKKVEEDYFIKEADSYIFFPLLISPWETPPAETATNEMISFRLLNLDKPNGIVGELFSHTYIPEYKKAVQHFNNKIEIDATVARLTPHAVFLDLFGQKIQARLPLSAIKNESIHPGDTIKVVITHLTPNRIVVEQVSSEA